MFDAINHPVILLRRIRFGDLSLHGLARGKYRHLTPKEVQDLRWQRRSRHIKFKNNKRRQPQLPSDFRYNEYYEIEVLLQHKNRR